MLNDFEWLLIVFLSFHGLSFRANAMLRFNWNAHVSSAKLFLFRLFPFQFIDKTCWIDCSCLFDLLHWNHFSWQTDRKINGVRTPKWIYSVNNFYCSLRSHSILFHFIVGLITQKKNSFSCCRSTIFVSVPSFSPKSC